MNQRDDEKVLDATGIESHDGGVEVSPVDDEFANVTPDDRSSDDHAEPEIDAAPGADEVTVPAHPKSVAREYFESMVVTFVMAIFGMTFITQAVKVPTGSMLNTILIEDHLMVNKFIFGNHASWMAGILPYRDIERGDIIVFKYPKDPEVNYVKRVVGLPGETIEVYGSRVYINGAELPENKVRANDPCHRCDLEIVGEPLVVPGARWTAYYDDLRVSGGPDESTFSLMAHDGIGEYGVGRKPFKIPDGHYFCMGDNRDNSEDSRVWGTVPRENVVGRAMFVYWSIDQQGRAEDEPSNLLSDFLERTRWGRTGTLIK
jgi:signal peptidase I